MIAEIEAYQAAEKALLELRAANFPFHSVVFVDCKPFKGQGIVVSEDCSPDQLAVWISNGNTWWYPLEACKLVHSADEWEGWIKTQKSKWAERERARAALDE